MLIFSGAGAALGSGAGLTSTLGSIFTSGLTSSFVTSSTTLTGSAWVSVLMISSAAAIVFSVEGTLGATGATSTSGSIIGSCGSSGGGRIVSTAGVSPAPFYQ